MVISSIDLKAMAALVHSMTTAAVALEGSSRSIKNTSERVFGPTDQAQKLAMTADWVRTQLPGLRRRLALAQQIEAQARGFQPGVLVDEAHLSTVPPDAAVKQGAAAALQVKNRGTDFDPALMAHIARYQNDPYFAAGFAQSMTPAELAELVLDISRMQDNRLRTNAKDFIAGTDQWKRDYTTLVTAVGTTVGTATRNTGELALPADYALQWVNAIIAEPKGNAEAPVPLGQRAAASLILRFGSYSTSFLDQVGSKVYDYERGLGEHADREWKARAAPGLARYGGPYDTAGGPQPDPLANILEALSHNPQAAQNFFDVANPKAALTGGLQIGERPVNERLKYLLQNRSWAPVGASSLGAALETASTNWRTHSPNGRVSATIAAQTLALIGQRTAGGDDWTMPVALRPAVARIISSYMTDVYRMRGVDNPAADPAGGSWVVDKDDLTFPAGQPFGAKLDPQLVEQVIATLGENKSDLQIVTAGVVATQQVRVGYALGKSLEDNPNSPVMIMTGAKVPFLANASLESAGVLGWVVSTAYGGDKADEELQKKRAEMLSKTLSVLGALPVFEIQSVGEWSKYAVEQLKDKALEEISKAPEGSSSAVYGEMDQQSRNALRNNTLSLMLQSGYLGPEQFAAASKAKGGETYQAAPETAFKGRSGPGGRWIADQPLQFDVDSPDYRSWARSYGENEWIQSNVYAPYDSQFPNIR